MFRRVLVGGALMLAMGLCYGDDALWGMFEAQGTEMVEFARTTSLNAAVRASAKSHRRGSDPRLTFRPDDRISEQIEKQAVASAGNIDEALGAKVESILSNVDVRQEFARDMAPYDLRADNVVDALTAYWVTMWMLANQASIPDPNAVIAAREQLTSAVTGNRELRGAGNENRQRIAETLMLETLLALGMRVDATRRGEQTDEHRRLAAAAHHNLIQRGIDLRQNRLTPQGFRTEPP